MLILKGRLPSARDARIYMSIERTYLGYLRLALYMLSFAVVLRKLQVLALYTHRLSFSALFDWVAVGSALLGVFLILTGV